MNQVSIIIPVHNTPEEYLRECLHSVLRQDYTNWEAILIDDGSTSGAERICDEYAAKDARFCVIHQRQSGVSAARNAGMAAAKRRPRPQRPAIRPVPPDALPYCSTVSGSCCGAG